MTVICERCGKSYFVTGARASSGQLLRLLCPHCGTQLWSALPGSVGTAAPDGRSVRAMPGKTPRGLS